MSTPRASHGPRALGGRGLLLTLVVVVSLSGASCPQIIQRYQQPLPRALPASPTLRQVMDVINANSARVQSFSASRGAIAIAGFPALRANLAFQREKNFRLRGETSITGPEVDLGSNNDEFWFWIRRAQPPALYYCRHDRYATSNARQILPVNPIWLIEALGVVTFDPTWTHVGPASVGSGRIEIRSTQPPSMSLEPLTRILVIDETRATVLEQHLYDYRGARLATAKLSKHQHDQASGVTMPRSVEIDWPATQFKITIELTELQINQPFGDPRQLFSRPQYASYHDIDLAAPGIEPAMPQSPAGGFPTASNPNAGWTPSAGAVPANGYAPPTNSPTGIAAGQGWSAPQGNSTLPPGSAPAPSNRWTAPANPYPLAPNAVPANTTQLAPDYSPAGAETATLPSYAAPRGR